MAKTIFQATLGTLAVSILLIFHPTAVRCDELIPANITLLDDWFARQLTPTTLETTLAAAEANTTVVTVRIDGGDFKSVQAAVDSVPEPNTKRVVISIGPGNYTERIKVPRSKPYITFLGDPINPPFLISSGTALQYGTVDSATLIVEADYFTAVNVNLVNNAPRPDGVMKLAMAAALRASGNGNAFYNVKMFGFQDTLCDDKGTHLFKDCYIEGTVDFIFGSGKSLYLNSELHVISGDPMAIIAAQARKADSDPDGYVFVHCRVTGTGGTAYLARSWFPNGRVIYAYSDLSDVVHAEGWSDNHHPETDSTVYFGEYNNVGAGAALDKRAPFTKRMTDADAAQFLSLAFIEGSKWLLPPARI